MTKTRNDWLKEMKPFRLYGDDAMNGWLLDNLEALGFVHFKEFYNPDVLHICPKDETRTVAIPTKTAIGMLKAIGYKVEKI